MNQDLKELREPVVQISWDKLFQAKAAARTMLLRQEYAGTARRPVRQELAKAGGWRG